MIERKESYNKYIKENVLHVEQESKFLRLLDLIEEHTIFYRGYIVNIQSRSDEMHQEVIGFADMDNYIPDLFNHADYLTELTHLANRMSDQQYKDDVYALNLSVDNYISFFQVKTRTETIVSKLGRLSNVVSDYDFMKLTSDYQKAEDKEAFIEEIRFSNITTYDFLQCKVISEITGMKTNSNMFFDEFFVVDVIMELVTLLIEDVRSFNTLYQSLKIFELEKPEYYQILNQINDLLNESLQETLTSILVIINQMLNIFGSAILKDEDKLKLIYLKKLIYDTIFIRDSSIVNKDLLEANGFIQYINNSMSSNLAVLAEFLRQKQELARPGKNNQKVYEKDPNVDYPEPIENLQLTQNQFLAIERDKNKEENESIDKSLSNWIESNQSLKDISDYKNNQSIQNVENIPSSLDYLKDVYSQGSSEYDEDFRGKIINSIAHQSKTLQTNATLIESTINSIVDVMSKLLEFIASPIKAILNIILTALRELICLIRAIVCVLTSIVSSVVNITGAVFSGVKSISNLKFVTKKMNTVPGEILTSVQDSAKEALDHIFSNIKSDTDKLADLIRKEKGAEASEAFKRSVDSAMVVCQGKASNTITNRMISFAKDKFQEIVEDSVNLLKSDDYGKCPGLNPNLNFGELKLPSLRFNKISLPDLSARLGNC